MKFNFLHIALLLTVSNVTIMAQSQQNHNFDKNLWNTDDNCAQCHVAAAGGTEAPMAEWQSKNLKSTFEIFSHGVAEEVPFGSTKICLSCHDGTAARINNSGSFKSNKKKIKTRSDAKHSHPVSVSLTSDMVLSGKYNDPATTLSGLGGTIANDLLKNGKVECVSCHDLHGNFLNSEKEDSQKANLIAKNSLWKYPTVSDLCNTCHRK